MGYLEELHAFGAAEVQAVVSDIHEEFDLPQDAQALQPAAAAAAPATANDGIDERMTRLEHSVVSVLSMLKTMVNAPRGALAQPADGAQ
jgi:hypothetical protein